jgi:CRISPR-associated protein Cst1
MTYTPDAPVGLRWTGHPLIDMGVAGLTVYSQKRHPEEVTGAHLEKFAKWAIDAYFTKEMTAWLSVVISLNDVKNASKSLDDQRKQALSVLLSFRDSTTELSCKCSFFDRAANRVLSRGLLPLLNADGQMNFGAEGQPGLPVSGLIVTVLQAMSLSVPLVSGRAMIIAPDDKDLLIQIINKWQPEIQSRIQWSKTSNEKAPLWGSPKTRLVGELIKLTKENKFHGSFSGITIYHATNSGKGADITIYTLEIPAIHFVRKAQNIIYKSAWEQLEKEAWQPLDKDKDPSYPYKLKIL